MTVAAVYQTIDQRGRPSEYNRKYVDKLRNSVLRHSQDDLRFLLITDSTEKFPGWDVYDMGLRGHKGWWAKMMLLHPSVRGPEPLVYLDLDTVVLGNLQPLLELNEAFGICRNFSGSKTCKFGSCVMTFAPEWGRNEWSEWQDMSEWAMDSRSSMFGDQLVYEKILGDRATILQDVLPRGFFLHKSKFTAADPVGSALAIFAGDVRPHNSRYQWVKDNWV